MFQVKKYNDNAAMLNNLTYTDYYYRLKMIAKAVRQWKNLPHPLKGRWIEDLLFEEGYCVFFEDPKIGYMVTKAASISNLNAYDEPISVNPIAANYTYKGPKLINGKNCVVIPNNSEFMPGRKTCQLFAGRLTDITRTIDINIQAQKTPVIIECSKGQLFSLKQVFKQFTGNEPAIYGNKDAELGKMINVLTLNAPIVFDKLEVQKHNIFNEFYTSIGVSNANQDKKERLVESEVNANDEQSDISAAIGLDPCQEAVELINKIFNEQIEVMPRRIDFNSDFNRQREGEKDAQ